MTEQGGNASVTSTIQFFPPVADPSFAGRSHGFFWFASSNRRTLSVYHGKTGLRQYTSKFEDEIQFCTTVTALSFQFLVVGVGPTLYFLRLSTGRREVEVPFNDVVPTCCCYVRNTCYVGTVGGGLYAIELEAKGNSFVLGERDVLLPLHPQGVMHGASAVDLLRMGPNRSTVTCMHYVPSNEMLVIGYAFGGFQCWNFEPSGPKFIYSSEVKGSTPVSHITSVVEGEDQSNILICACCSYTGAPFLEGWPWAAENPEVGNNSTDGSFSMVHMRCRSQIEFVQTKDHQLLSEGSEDYHITNFVGVQGLTYCKRSFVMLAWNDRKTSGGGTRVHSVLVELTSNGSLHVNIDTPKLSLIYDALPTPVLEFRALPDTLSCVRRSMFLNGDDSRQEPPALSFSSLVLGSNACVVVEHCSVVKQFLQSMLQAGPTAFDKSKVTTFFTKAQEIPFFNPDRVVLKDPLEIDMQKYLYKLCLFYDLTPLLNEYISCLRAEDEPSDFVSHTLSSPFLLQIPRALAEWARETFYELRRCQAHLESITVNNIKDHEQVIRGLQEVLARMLDIDTIFHELKQRENTPEGFQELERNQDEIQCTIQILELSLWFRVDKRIKLVHPQCRSLDELLVMSYRSLSNKYFSNVDHSLQKHKSQHLRPVVGMTKQDSKEQSGRPVSFIGMLANDLSANLTYKFQYPPDSTGRILEMVGASPANLIKKKRGIILYTLIDLVYSVVMEGRYDISILQESVIQSFCQRFLIERQDQLLVFGFWLLDNGKTSMAAQYLRDPSISLPVSYLVAIMRHLHDFGDYHSLIEFVQVRNLALSTLEDVVIYMTTLLAISSLTEAFRFMRSYSRAGLREGVRDKAYTEALLFLLFDSCYKKKEMPKLFKLPFDREEEQYLRLYLNVNAKGGDKDLLLIAYYLQKGEYATAISHYNSIASDVAKVQSEAQQQINTLINFAKQMLSDIELNYIDNPIVPASGPSLEEAGKDVAMVEGEFFVKEKTRGPASVLQWL